MTEIHETPVGATTTTDDCLLAEFASHLDQARIDGVPVPLVERARQYLLQTRSFSRAHQLLQTFTGLATARPIEQYAFNFPELLQTADERLAALGLVKKSLASATRPADIETLTVQKFRLTEASPFDDDVAQFVRHGMDDALAVRRGGFQSR